MWGKPNCAQREKNEQPFHMARYFSQITVLLEGALLEAPLGQSTEEFPSHFLTASDSRKHERQKKEEENSRGALALKTFRWV